MLWDKATQEDTVTKYKKITVGKVHGLYGGITSEKTIGFTYYASGKYHEGSDRINGGNPRRIRLSKPQIGKYYVVEYDSTNHNLHRIVIGSKPIDPRLELGLASPVEGCVEKQKSLDQYVDLYVNYKVKGQSYDVRTRLHKDSLNIYKTDNCPTRKGIPMEVSIRYPYFNNLYYKSHDRQYKGAYSTQGKWKQ